MAKAIKLGEQWATDPPSDVHKKEVLKVLDEYFPGQWRRGKGSHIIVSNPKLKGLPECNVKGEFTIVIKHGQRVKGFYLKRLARIIKLLEMLSGAEKGD